MSATMAAAAPLYGTCTMLIPASCLNSSIVTCVVERLPTVPKRISPGLLLARATSSFTVLAGSEGCATRIKSDVEMRLIAAKSRNVSYGRLGTALWTTAFGVPLPTSSV